MAPISPGRPAGLPRKAPKPTATEKTHRFEPFSKRIARLKIDPIHRIERNGSFDEDLSLTQSHFRTAYDHWADLNQSETYRTFARQVRSKCESLPQILHYADSITEFLVAAIKKRDENSLEPLLSLVEALAHDLGERFEKYFEEFVTLALQVAASHSAANVIEWCFRCVTWIFRFLSRLLVPDLRPLLAIILPYLGSERQKPYITRFAAESLAFLLRKAAMKWSAIPLHLTTAIKYLLFESRHRLNEQLDQFRYEVGIMTLFSEAAMGVDGNVHSSAPALVSCVLQCLLENDQAFDSGRRILHGTIVSLIHQTDAVGFEPVFGVIEGSIMNMPSLAPDFNVFLLAGLFHQAVGTRKGSRVTQWTKCNMLALHLASIGQKAFSTSSMELLSYSTTVAMMLQYAPDDELLAQNEQLLRSIINLSSPSQLFAFCDIFAKLGRERFEIFLLPHLQSYVLSQWQHDETGLLLLLQRLRNTGALSEAQKENTVIVCPMDWEKDILERCQECAAACDTHFDVRIDGFLQLALALKFPKGQQGRLQLQNTLHAFIEYGLQTPDISADTKARFSLGRAFQTYLLLSQSASDLDCSFWALICKGSVQKFMLIPFLEGLRTYVNQTTSLRLLATNERDYLRDCLLPNLLTESTGLKLRSLQLLQEVFASSDEWLDAAFRLMTDILSMPYTLKKEREITAQLREVARLQKRCASTTQWRQLLPCFSMGLMSHYHGNLLQQLCSAIGDMCSESEAEQFVIDTCIKWLQTAGPPPPLPAEESESHKPEMQNPSFQCSSLMAVDFVTETVLSAFSRAEELLVTSFMAEHSLQALQMPSSSRRLALQLFLAIPQRAEKRSKQLVPVFIGAYSAQKKAGRLQDAALSVSSHTLSPELGEQIWSYSDRKLFLELFGKFVNPVVLYREHEVREVIYELLGNGSCDTQQAAIKALLTWKDSSILPYAETLLRLLDGKVDSGELDLLLHPEPDQSSIDLEHRAGLIPVLLRLIFGLMINQSRSKGGQEGRRKSLLRKVFNLSADEINIFLTISFGSLSSLSMNEISNMQKHAIDIDILPTDQQYGFLRTMQTMLNILKTRISLFGDRILPPLLYCLIRAAHQINQAARQSHGDSHQPASSLVRNVRKAGLECLIMIFEYCEDVDWSLYTPAIFEELVQPRLPALPIETAQGISGILKLFSVWAKSDKNIVLFQRNFEVIRSVIDCIVVPSAKDEVKLFVLDDILLPIATLADQDPQLHKDSANIIRNVIEPLLHNLDVILQGSPSQNMLEAVVRILPMLAPFASNAPEAQNLLSSLTSVLGGRHNFNPKIKGGLLKAVQSLLQDHYKLLDLGTRDQVYDSCCALFNYFKDGSNRATLCSILAIFAHFDQRLVISSQICLNLNNYQSQIDNAQKEDRDQFAPTYKSTKNLRLDEVEYTQQIEALAAINELVSSGITTHSWKPIIYNLLYFVRANTEFSIRSTAASCLKNFIANASREKKEDVEMLVQLILLPALEKGLKEPSELVRADFIAMLGVVVENLGATLHLQDMKALLFGGDFEASFYTNVLHVQQHRRIRAIRRLIAIAEEGGLQAKNVSRYFLPLLEMFVYDSDENEQALALKGHSILAISSLLKWIEWPTFRISFRRYRGLMDSNVIKIKHLMKLLGGSIETLSQATKEAIPATASSAPTRTPLASTIPSSTIVATELRTFLIPKLTEYVKHKDEAQASLRLPTSVVAIQAILMLPPEEVTIMVPGILLDICNILRSRDQHIRDEARNTLAEVSTLLGPTYLHLIVKELRTALNRGYQIHVLTYTMHKIILTMTPQLQPGELDFCLPELISLLMDDIFGAAGLEKDNDDYVSAMKEVKGNKRNSKSFGMVEALARVTSVRKVSALLEPLRILLTGPLNSKQRQHADEVLRRIGMGLVQNRAAGSQDILLLCYELVANVYTTKDLGTTRTNEEITTRPPTQASSNQGKSDKIDSSGLHKIHRFALDLLRSTLQRHQNLLTVENLYGFLPLIGDAIIGRQEEVKTAGFRVLSTIIKLPIAELHQNAATYLHEAVQVVENAPNTNSDAPQAALKLVASILREKPNVELRRKDVEYLLHKVIPDLEDPDRQGSSFSLIKAIMAREIKTQEFQLPEVYEMADRICVVMISNQAPSTQNIARGIFIQFLLEYPQKKSRWEKQLRFLAENLEYEYPEGRQSVMETINMLITQLRPERAQESISWFFLPTVLRIANDDNQSCRDMAGALLERLFSKADSAEKDRMLQSMRAWIGQTGDLNLMASGMQSYVHFLRAVGPEKEAHHICTSIENVILGGKDEVNEDMKLRLQALDLYAELVAVAPASTMTRKQTKMWTKIQVFLSDAEPAIQCRAVSLINRWFQDIMIENSKPELNLQPLPLTGTYGLELDKMTMIRIFKLSLRVLRHIDGTLDTVSTSTVQNLLFLAKCFDANKATIDVDQKAEAGFPGDDSSESNGEQTTTHRKIPAIQYLLHQLSATIRRETDRLTSAALQSKNSTLLLLLALIPQLSSTTLTEGKTLINLLQPLRHLTAEDLAIPKSADPTFEVSYKSLIASAHDIIEALQSKIGDGAYIQAMTQAGREIRDRREERRMKRRIGAIVDPERSVVRKKVKNEKKSARKKVVAGVHRTRRTLI